MVSQLFVDLTLLFTMMVEMYCKKDLYNKSVLSGVVYYTETLSQIATCI